MGKGEYFMNQCNERWKKIILGWIEGGMNNIRGDIRWEFIQNHNKAVRIKKPLISPYFSVFEKKMIKKIFACNGWIGESEDPNNPAPCFTEKGTYYYIKRKINIFPGFLLTFLNIHLFQSYNFLNILINIHIFVY